MSEQLLRRYLPISRELLEKHRLTVPDRTTEMIARTIMKCRVLEPRPKKQKGQEPSPRERLKKARTHAVKLLEYSQRAPSHADSISKRSRSLYEALNDPGTSIWLGSVTPLVDVPELRDHLQTRGLNQSELTSLIQALRSILSESAKSTGRPTKEITRVVCGGCTAWVQAGRPELPQWNEISGRLEGRLPEFIRDLISYCDATHQRMRVDWEFVLPSRPAATVILKRLDRAGIRVLLRNDDSLSFEPESLITDSMRELIRLQEAAVLGALKFDARRRGELKITDPALHSQLKVALHFCKRALARPAR